MLDAVVHCKNILETPEMSLSDYVSEHLETLMSSTNQEQSLSSLSNDQGSINLNDVVVVFNKSDSVDKTLLIDFQKILSSPIGLSCCVMSCLNKDGVTHFLETLAKKIEQR